MIFLDKHDFFRMIMHQSNQETSVSYIHKVMVGMKVQLLASVMSLFMCVVKVVGVNVKLLASACSVVQLFMCVVKVVGMKVKLLSSVMSLFMCVCVVKVVGMKVKLLASVMSLFMSVVKQDNGLGQHHYSFHNLMLFFRPKCSKFYNMRYFHSEKGIGRYLTYSYNF